MTSLVPPSSFSVSSSYCREEDDEEQSTADGNNNTSLLPKVIHFTSSSSSAVTDSSSSSNANADADYITPIKSSKSFPIRSPQRQHGILKSSSYKKKSFNNDVSSTPSTVATVETIMSFDSNSSASASASASGGTVNTSSVTSSNSSASAETTPISSSSSSSLAVLVATRPAALFATPPRLRLSSSSVSLSTVDSSTSSFSTSTSNSKTSSSTVLTEKQRNARIKHIEDLNERIQEAKQNKIITKNKYKKEDKLILKLARNLKRSCNETVKNELKIKHLEEENEQIKTNWLNTRKELNELKHIRIQIENKLQTNHQQHLEKERIRQSTILDDQKQQLVKTNTDHQLYCHELCVNVLDASTDLNRLRDTMNTQLSKEEKEKQRIRNKYSKNGKRRMSMTMLLLMASAAVAAILSLLLVPQGTTNIDVSEFYTSLVFFFFKPANCYYRHIQYIPRSNSSDLIFHSKYSHHNIRMHLFAFFIIISKKYYFFYTVVAP
jgi:hypothetical protein